MTVLGPGGSRSSTGQYAFCCLWVDVGFVHRGRTTIIYRRHLPCLRIFGAESVCGPVGRPLVGPWRPRTNSPRFLIHSPKTTDRRGYTTGRRGYTQIRLNINKPSLNRAFLTLLVKTRCRPSGPLSHFLTNVLTDNTPTLLDELTSPQPHPIMLIGGCQ